MFLNKIYTHIFFLIVISLKQRFIGWFLCKCKETTCRLLVRYKSSRKKSKASQPLNSNGYYNIALPNFNFFYFYTNVKVFCTSFSKRRPLLKKLGNIIVEKEIQSNRRCQSLLITINTSRYYSVIFNYINKHENLRYQATHGLLNARVSIRNQTYPIARWRELKLEGMRN